MSDLDSSSSDFLPPPFPSGHGREEPEEEIPRREIMIIGLHDIFPSPSIPFFPLLYMHTKKTFFLVRFFPSPIDPVPYPATVGFFLVPSLARTHTFPFLLFCYLLLQKSTQKNLVRTRTTSILPFPPYACSSWILFRFLVFRSQQGARRWEKNGDLLLFSLPNFRAKSRRILFFFIAFAPERFLSPPPPYYFRPLLRDGALNFRETFSLLFPTSPFLHFSLLHSLTMVYLNPSFATSWNVIVPQVEEQIYTRVVAVQKK